MPQTATPEQLKIVEDRAPNVATMFYDRVAASPNREAYRFPDENETWHSLTWAQTGEQVDRIAAGLVALGVQPEERVAIVSGTRYEWIFADLGVNAAGAATTTVYPTTTVDDEKYILTDSASRVVFAEDDEQVKKLLEIRSELPDVVKVVTFASTLTDGDWIISLDDLEALGSEHLASNPTAVTDRVAAISRDDLATLIYTSGTTGRPKGAAIDGRVPKIVENLAIVKPTFMGAAPRIFEKAYGRIINMTEEEGGAKLKIFRWAEKVGLEHSRAVRAGKPVSPALKAKHAVADKLIFSKVRARFGGRVRFFISGAAALSPDIAEWFHAAGVLILEGYGLTETSAGSFVNHPDAFKLGSVGLVMPGTEVRVADDREILIKGPGVMRGYHNLESESATTVTDDGWLHTGDEGRVDEDGFLFITGRKKELFKTSGGKYVAPPHIEGVFKGISSMTSQIIVHGNERNFCSALITLDPDAVAEWAEAHGMQGKSYAEVVKSPEIHAIVSEQVEELNQRLNRWETIKKWEILDHDLSVESGELTPSMKVKRAVVEANHKDLLDSFYA